MYAYFSHQTLIDFSFPGNIKLEGLDIFCPRLTQEVMNAPPYRYFMFHVDINTQTSLAIS